MAHFLSENKQGVLVVVPKELELQSESKDKVLVDVKGIDSSYCIFTDPFYNLNSSDGLSGPSWEFVS